MAFATDLNESTSPETPTSLVTRKSLIKTWGKLSKWLPENLDESAKQHRAAAFQSHSRFKNALDLLHVICLWATTDYSLQTVATWARARQFEISAPALYKRIGRSKAWLEALLKHLFSQIETENPVRLKGRWHVLLADATVIPFADTKLKMHWAFDVGTMCIQQIHFFFDKLHKGETWCNYKLAANQLWLGDAAYATASQFAHLCAHNAHGLARYSRALRLYETDDLRAPHLDLESLVKPVVRGCPVELTVFIRTVNGPLKMRIFIKKLSKQAAKNNRDQMKDKVRRQTLNDSVEARVMTNYVILITTMLTEDLSMDEALDLYRLRWQIELLFKRAKSTMKMNAMPCKKSHQHAAVWILAHLLMQLLLDQQNASRLKNAPKSMREQVDLLIKTSWDLLLNMLKHPGGLDDGDLLIHFSNASRRPKHRKKHRSHERLTSTFSLPDNQLWTR